MKEYKLSELADIIGGGTPKTSRSDYWGGDIPWLSVVDFNNDFRHVFTTEKTITEAGLNNSSTRILYPGEIIISARGTVGALAQVAKEMAFNQSCYGLRAKPGITCNDYLFYLLRHSIETIKKNTHGSVFDTITRDTFESISVILPDLKTQQKVASILTAFDDKIELNAQINHNLEEQAKAIFKSWLVDFEPFAGKEPDGSKMVDLQSICELVTKGTTPTTLGFAFTQDGINFIKAESISDTHSFDIDKFSYIDQQTNNALKRSIIQDGDILFTIAGTLGRFAIADKSILPANTNQAVAIIRPKLTEVHPYYIYSFLLGGWHTEHYRKRVQQAVQANLSLTTIKSLPILLLPETLKQQYENIITPLFKKILQNTLENRTLCKLRDALLPKLMSGEIDVSEVEI